MPKVSIVIPVYNVEKYLRECLDSVINQTLRDIEIICINDGSTDNSADILAEYQNRENRLKVISQENGGQSKARNAGLEVATGEYIYFLDSDDYIKTNSLEKLYTIAKTNNLDILYFDSEVIFENDNLKNQFPEYLTAYDRKNEYTDVLNGKDLFCKLVTNNAYVVQPCLQFTKRKYLEEKNIQFLEGIIYEDNLYTFVSILQAERVAHIKDKLYVRRIRPNSTMTDTKFRFFHFYSSFMCYIRMLQFSYSIPQDEVLEKAIVKVLSGVFRSAQEKYNSISHYNLFEAELDLIKNMNYTDRMLMKHLGFEFPETYLFPFGRIKYGSKIILYGAGKVGNYYYNQIEATKYCEIKLWVDQNYEKLRKCYKIPVQSPENIFHEEYDFIIVAVEDEDLYLEIRAYLISKGVLENKIIWEKPLYIGA
jgi:glycosyltransferase involved in cell wall biosynthesis